jgi:hypothetical protein
LQNEFKDELSILPNLDLGRRANGEGECYEALFGRNWLRPKRGYGHERGMYHYGRGFGRRGMGGDTDGTLGRFGRIRMLMHSECYC